MKKQFPWGQDYFVARVLLGLSEEEFWKSSPRTIYSLKLYRDKYFSLSKPKKSNEIQVQEILNLLGR